MFGGWIVYVGYTEQTMHRNLNTKLEQSDTMEVKVSFISRTNLAQIVLTAPWMLEVI